MIIDVVENFRWAFCKIIKHVEVEVNIVVLRILTLSSSCKSTVSVLRLKEFKIFVLIIATINSSSTESIEFDILGEELCFIDHCATSSWKWGYSAVQTETRSRTSSMSRNSSSERPWFKFFNEWNVFFSVSKERLQRLSKSSMNGKQRSFT